MYDKVAVKEINSSKVWSQDELKIAVSDIENEDKAIGREREILGISKCSFSMVTSVSCEREILKGLLWVRSGLWKNIEIIREISRTGGPFPGTRNFEKNRDIFP